MKDETEKFKFSYTKFSLHLGHIKQIGIWGKFVTIKTIKLWPSCTNLEEKLEAFM